MTPTPVPEHASNRHPALQRAINTVLRNQYEGNGSSGDAPAVDHHKIVGGHLLLTKRSSTPAPPTHAALTATTSLLTNYHHHQKAAVITNTCNNNTDTPLTSSNMDLLVNVGGIHKRLDRSHSEPVWQQQQQQQQQQTQDGRQGTNSSRYKTELCRPFEENGFCKYGDKCQFAHGGIELRTLNRHPKYKTELCRTFHTIGICPYGPRCHFIHNAEESRVLSPIMGPAPPGMSHHLASLGLTPSINSNFNSGGSSPPISPHTPLSVTPSSMVGGLPTIFDSKFSSPPASLHGSPTSSGVFFDESPYGGTSSLAPSFTEADYINLIGSLSTLELNNKVNNIQSNLTNQLNQITNHLNNLNNNKLSSINNNSFSDLLNEKNQSLLVSNNIDTPPASPPDTSSCPTTMMAGSGVFEESPSLNSSPLRLPIFQSINPVQ